VLATVDTVLTVVGAPPTAEGHHVDQDSGSR
jgi:hypothetical protein